MLILPQFITYLNNRPDAERTVELHSTSSDAGDRLLEGVAFRFV